MLAAVGTGALALLVVAVLGLSHYFSKGLPPEIIQGETVRDTGGAGERPQIQMIDTLWVLSIGINDYGSRDLNLEFADHDALKIAEMLKKQKNRLFKKVGTVCLINDRAGRESILNAVDRISQKANAGDVVFIFVAGHGVIDPRQKEYYFLPSGANPDNVFTKGLRWSEFSGIVKILSTRVKKLVLAVDTCHAGATARADLASEVKMDSGYILSAGKASEVSIENQRFRLPNETRGHGVFTYAILQGLSGDADLNHDGIIKVEELFEYIAKKIPELTGNRQHPYRVVTGTESIVIALTN